MANPIGIIAGKIAAEVAEGLTKKAAPVVAKTAKKVATSADNKVASKAKTPRSNIKWRDFGQSGYGTLADKKGKRFEFDISIRPPEGARDRDLYSPFHQVKLYDKGKSVGRLEWSDKTGEILAVDVNAEYRRRGLATKMLRLAEQSRKKYPDVVAPAHSRDRTPAGEAWARSVGGDIPPLVGTLPGEAAAEAASWRRIAIMNLRKPNPTEAEIKEELARMNARLPIGNRQ